MTPRLSMHLKSCRCCAKLFRAGMKTVEISRSIEKRFFELSRIKLIMSDRYSKVICETCNSKLAEYWDFKNEISEYQKNLHDYVESQDYAEIEGDEEEQIIIKEEVQAEDLISITEMKDESESDDDYEDPFEQVPPRKKLKKSKNAKVSLKNRYDASKSRLIRAKTLSEEGRLYRDSVIGKHPVEEVTSRGGIKLSLNNYFYHKDRARTNGEIMWRCSSRHGNNPCSAILITTFDKETGIYTVVDIGKSAHSHEPAEEKKRPYRGYKKSDPNKPKSNIFRPTVTPDRDFIQFQKRPKSESSGNETSSQHQESGTENIQMTQFEFNSESLNAM